MLTLNIPCDLLPERLVASQLSQEIRLGRHELVIEPEELPSQAATSRANYQA